LHASATVAPASPWNICRSSSVYPCTQAVFSARTSDRSSTYRTRRRRIATPCSMRCFRCRNAVAFVTASRSVTSLAALAAADRLGGPSNESFVAVEVVVVVVIRVIAQPPENVSVARPGLVRASHARSPPHDPGAVNDIR
jgi:hypothetical protein